MKWLKIIRSAEWWEYKLSPLLGIGYATILKLGGQIFDYWRWLFIILLSLAAGATYVSIINDITDLNDDIIAGKKNRMLNLPVYCRWLLPLLGLLSGLFFEYTVYYPDTVSMILYLVPWLLFSLYSFPPFRFKNRGIAGILCDAGGSHVFTTLLMVSSITFIMSQPIDRVWLTLTGIWALCYGLRGILWHQYADRENDIHSGLRTVATQTPPGRFRLTETIIFTIELLATLGIFLYLANPWIIIAYMFYVLLCFLRSRFLGQQPVVVLSNHNAPLQILQLDYFQCIFPLTLLIYATIIDRDNLLPLVFHLVFFPATPIRMIKDLKKIGTMIIRR
ncbi:MAG TPA: UbiA family prenyltransferase [Niabella sp.]